MGALPPCVHPLVCTNQRSSTYRSGRWGAPCGCPPPLWVPSRVRKLCCCGSLWGCSWAYHVSAGTTTKGLSAPICSGPSSAAVICGNHESCSAQIKRAGYSWHFADRSLSDPASLKSHNRRQDLTYGPTIHSPLQLPAGVLPPASPARTRAPAAAPRNRPGDGPQSARRPELPPA